MRLWLAAILLGLLGASTSGCHCEWQPPDFVIDDPGPDGIRGEEPEPAGPSDPEVDRELAEADLVTVLGDRIYTLSAYSGLTVIDAAAPARQLPVLGRLPLPAQPVAMFVGQDDQLLVLTNDHGHFEPGPGSASGRWLRSARMLALDARDPAAIVVRSEHAIPGRIEAARRVGDIVYVVSFEDGRCWHCAPATPRTVISSLDASQPDRILTVEQLVLLDAVDDPWDRPGPRPVMATDERLYVAGVRYEDAEHATTFVDVLDITDPGGHLVRGASFDVVGSITESWQMHEHERVLRVVSQPWPLGGVDQPVLETFDVSSVEHVGRLATLRLPIPSPTRLQAVRFDERRGYAVTMDRDAPLLVVDITDPKAPSLPGRVPVSGFVQQLEPRRNRLLVLAFDPADPAGSLSLRLWDVSAPIAPVLLSQQSFAGRWPALGDESPRLHPSMTVLDDGLVVVPYAGWEPDDEVGQWWCGRIQGGSQLVDWRDDALALRGLAASRGRARRALLHRDHLLTLSEQTVQAFDVTDRDHPTATAEAPLAVHVAMVAGQGNTLVRLARDWWSGDPILEVVTPADPSAAEPRGRLALGEQSDELRCDRSWPVALWVDDGHAYLLRQTYDPRTFVPSLRLDTFDVSPPWSPRWTHTLALPVALDPDRIGRVGYGAERPAVLVGDRLAVSTTEAHDSSRGQAVDRTAWLDVIDLGDPARPRRVGALRRPPATAHGELQVIDDTVVSWHMEEALDEPGRVRLYLDRFDLSDAEHPVADPPINVPGQVVSMSPTQDRAVVVSFVLETVDAPDASSCGLMPKAWSYDESTGTCTLAHRPLELVSLGPVSAARIDRFDAEGRRRELTGVLASAGRMFVTVHDHGHGVVAEDDATAATTGLVRRPQDRLLVLTGHEDDLLEERARITLPDDESTRMLATHGPRVLVSGDSGLGLVDATDPAQPTLVFEPTPGRGCLDVAIVGDVAYCALGPFGLQALPIP